MQFGETSHGDHRIAQCFVTGGASHVDVGRFAHLVEELEGGAAGDVGESEHVVLLSVRGTTRRSGQRVEGRREVFGVDGDGGADVTGDHRITKTTMVPSVTAS